MRPLGSHPPAPCRTPPTHTQGHTSSIAKVPETSLIVLLAFALTSLVTGLRTFGQEQLIYLVREAQVRRLRMDARPAGQGIPTYMYRQYGCKVRSS